MILEGDSLQLPEIRWVVREHSRADSSEKQGQ